MPHLNGSLTNIFTVINVFRDIIPLRVFSAFFTLFRFFFLVQGTRANPSRNHFKLRSNEMARSIQITLIRVNLCRKVEQHLPKNSFR